MEMGMEMKSILCLILFQYSMHLCGHDVYNEAAIVILIPCSFNKFILEHRHEASSIYSLLRDHCYPTEQWDLEFCL